MKKIRSRVENFIKGDFSPPPLSFEWFLQCAAVLYSWVMKVRFVLYKKGILTSHELGCTVISVGNITAGGTGKTPMTMYVAKHLKSMGFKIAVVSRGYRGGLEREGGVVSDGNIIFFPPHMAGDEPYLMAKQLKVPVVVGKDRYRAGMKAIELFSPDVIILDDAFQHLKLKRDLDIVLLDNFRPTGNGRTLPAGLLREGVSALTRGDIFIMTRSDKPMDSKTIAQIKQLRQKTGKKAIFKSCHKTCLTGFFGKDKAPLQGEAHDTLELLKGRKCFLFSGLGNNRQFRESVEALGVTVEDHLEFPDHHRYIPQDLEKIKKGAKHPGVDLILTTEKDFVKIPEMESWNTETGVLGIVTTFKNDDDLQSHIINCVAKKQNRNKL